MNKIRLAYRDGFWRATCPCCGITWTARTTYPDAVASVGDHLAERHDPATSWFWDRWRAS